MKEITFINMYLLLIFICYIIGMVLLYKDPDGVDVFTTLTGPQFTVDITQGGGQQDFVDIDAFKHKIKQLEI